MNNKGTIEEVIVIDDSDGEEPTRGASGKNAETNNKGTTTEVIVIDETDSDGGELSRGASGKRRAGSQAQSPAKRARQGFGYLESADKWVAKTYGSSDGIAIKFGNNVYQFKIPKAVLEHIGYFKEDYLKNYLGDSQAQQTIECQEAVPSEAFDMILQWLATNQIKLNNRRYPTLASKLDTYMLFARAAITLGVEIEDKKSTFIGYLKEILVEDRYTLQSRHIKLAYIALKSHDKASPIRDIFAMAATKDYIEYRDDPHEIRHIAPIYDSDEEGVDEARRSAFTRSFRFDREMRAIPEFKHNLQDLFEKAWRTREWLKNGNTRTSGRYFLDPLTEDRFLCD